MALVYLQDALELSSEYGEQLTSGLARVGEADAKQKSELAKAISKQDRFFREGKNLSVKSQKDRISETLKCFASAKRLSQEKQAIVGKLSSNMDKLLKHVESKLREFEAELEVTNPGCSQKLAEQSLSLDSQDAQRIESLPFSRPSRSSSSSTPSKPISSKLRKQKERAVQSEEEDTRLYCLCNRTSFGEMIACDNPHCAIEWFHYDCIGLTEAPIGKWFCPKCTESQPLKKKKSRKQNSRS